MIDLKMELKVLYEFSCKYTQNAVYILYILQYMGMKYGAQQQCYNGKTEELFCCQQSDL